MIRISISVNWLDIRPQSWPPSGLQVCPDQAGPEQTSQGASPDGGAKPRNLTTFLGTDGVVCRGKFAISGASPTNP